MALKIVCLVKQTLPTEAKISILPDGTAGDDKAKPIVNPYDEFAIEEAVRLVDKKLADEVTLIGVGSTKIEESLRRGLAMGAHKAILIDTGTETFDEARVATVIAAQLSKMTFDLVLCGKVAVDSNAGEVPGRVATALGLPLLHVATKLEVADGKVLVHRSADGRSVVVEAALPAVVSADKSLNTPRYPNLPSIMGAKKKPLEIVPAAGLLNGTGAARKAAGFELPPARGPVKMITGDAGSAAKSLVLALRDEAKVVR